MSDWDHDRLAADLMDSEHRAGRIAIERLSIGPYGDGGQIDVASMRLSWIRPRTTAFEIKISRADFLSDVRSAKWRRYLRVVERVYFAVPAGLVEKKEIPAGAGLIVRNARGWHSLKAARRPHDVLPLTDAARLTFVSGLLFRHYPTQWDGNARMIREMRKYINQGVG